MTVRDLRSRLSKYDDNMEVLVQYRDDGGDYYGQDGELLFREETLEKGSTYKCVRICDDGSLESYDKLVEGDSIKCLVL